ncbi:phosphoesterase [Bifidobacterium ramosum]|nr:alkaline phosphatase family protein [Bifidobacterium ramosum]KAB8287510.1 phosphoesterase [Bifidobacterium ramosum]
MKRAGIAALVAASCFAMTAPTAFANDNPSTSPSETTITQTGLKPGQIKHVWTIILENKSYDATFTGLNQNSYLWKTLPSQGALLTNYYGTGHYSMDNYITLVSGQATSKDLQEDCGVKNFDFGKNSDIITEHTGKTAFDQNDNYGQVKSPAGPNAANGENGCTLPKDAPTLFNQLDAAGLTWKGYAQDLGNQPGREDGLGGAPGKRENNPTTNPKVMKPSDEDKQAGITSFTGAQENDQYVAKHFPFPWFHAITGDDNTGTDSLTKPANGGTMTDKNHIANLDDQTYGLIADLKKPADQVPAFNWITPNNCSDAHDAVCKGNNLSGLFDDNLNPNYNLPLDTAPKNHTGGLYAADLWLRYYIPLIERSAAFKDGGLIDITFDEANPPFYGMSFNNATDDTKVANDAKANEKYQYAAPTMKDFQEGYKQYSAGTFPQAGPMAKNYINADLAGQNINGQDVNWEPEGPNTPLATDKNGNQLYPGSGDNGYITRPPSCDDPQDADLVNADKSNCVPGARNTGSGFSEAEDLDATAKAGTDTIQGSVSVTDIGRKVTGEGIPDGAYVGSVVNEGPNMVATSKDPVTSASFKIVDMQGNPLKTTGDVTEVTLSATGIPGHLNDGETPLSTFDAQDATPGGGDTGSVLISPLIKPGTVVSKYYNHYSWLRTMEDIFQVSKGNDNRKLTAGTVSGGLDGQGHLGFAAQAGLAPFGSDVFTAAATNGNDGHQTGNNANPGNNGQNNNGQNGGSQNGNTQNNANGSQQNIGKTNSQNKSNATQPKSNAQANNASQNTKPLSSTGVAVAGFVALAAVLFAAGLVMFMRRRQHEA